MRRAGVWHGPPWRWPGPLDHVAEWWARRPPRLRALVVALVTLAAAAAYGWQVARVDARYGGAPVPVLVATRDLAVGEPPDGVVRRRLPPVAVPDDALREVPDGQVVAVPLLAGGVLTAAHLDARGPAAAVAADQRVLPIPLEPTWAVEGGSFVDLWALAGDATEGVPVARSRHVLQVTGEGTRPVALVVLDHHEVAPVVAALAAGHLVVSHAPPPTGD